MRQLQTRDDLEPVDTRNIEVEDGEIRRTLPCHFDCGLPVLRLQNLDDAEQLHKMRLDDQAKCGVVVHNQDSSHCVVILTKFL